MKNSLQMLQPEEGLTMFFLFGISMSCLVWLCTRRTRSIQSFLAADRNVSLFRGALSLAVTWIWAPALFICSMQGFLNGLPGVFWFTAPNILCFFLFAPLAVRLRRRMPDGFTLPEFINQRFSGDTRVHLTYVSLSLSYQLGSLVINSLAGGGLLHAVSGIDIKVSILMMSSIALGYTWLSGLKASIFTDTIQMLMVLALGFVLIPWCLGKAGDSSLVERGLGGVEGLHRSLFDPWIAFSVGIPMTLGLLSGPITDQVFYQRAWAVRQKDLVRMFLLGGLIFGCVPLLLSTLGFLGAGLVQQGALTVSDPQYIGPTVIAHILSKPALLCFCLMTFAALCSTMDSACCAVASLGSIDIYKRYLNPNASENELLKASRLSMLILTLVGTCIALLQPKLLWVFLIYGAIASAGMFPTLFAFFSERVTARVIFLSLSIPLVLGTPISIYANITENTILIVLASIFNTFLGLGICAFAHFSPVNWTRSVRWQFAEKDRSLVSNT